MNHRGKWVCVALLALAAAGVIGHALVYSFVSDDAYISFRYAHNLAYHDELTFNLGERVEGYTNFLWTVILGLLLKLRLRPDAMSQILGAGFGVAVLVLTHVVTRLYRGGRPGGWDCLAAMMLAGMSTFAVWCTGGLETQMFTALIMGGVALYLAEHSGRVRWRLSGVLFALAAMTRPEGALVFGLTAVHRAVANLALEGRLRPRLREIGWVAGFLVPFGLFFLWRYSYYGFPFPNTYYIKAGDGASASVTKWGLPYLWDFIKDNKLYPLPLLVFLFRPRTCWRPPVSGASLAGGPSRPGARPDGMRPSFVWSYVALIVGVYVAYVVKVGGDFMALGRFFLPVLPLIAFFVQEAIREIVDRPARAPDAWSPPRFAVTAAALVAALAVNSLGLYRENQKMTYRRWGLDTIAYLKKFAADRILVGAWMRRHLPKDTHLAVGGAGAIVYASRLRSLDTFGLNDSWIAHHTPRVGDRPGHTKFAPEDYILGKHPDLMCHQARHQDWPHNPGKGGDPYWRARGYHWVCIDPPGLRPSHYCCLKLARRDLGPFPPAEGS